MTLETATKPRNRATVEILSDTEVLITRRFDAPRDLVFEAITTPGHVCRWYGPAVMTVVECTIDLRVGGKWRYVLRMPDGTLHGFNGEYREIVAPARIVSTENYEPIGPGHEMIATVTLAEQGSGTIFRNRLVYPSRADRDGHLQSGMETGMQESFDRLEAIVARTHR